KDDSEMAIGRTEDRDTPWNPTVLRHRVHVPGPDPRNPSGPAVKPTAHTGRTHDRNRPDPSQLPNPCNPGAVHTWIPGSALRAVPECPPSLVTRANAPILRRLPHRSRDQCMQSAALDVVGIGNAIVDVIAHADEQFLAERGFAKGAMTLVDAERAESLYREIGPAIESSGGSAGNTMAGIASLGGTGGYIGKVRDDLLGEVFRHD